MHIRFFKQKTKNIFALQQHSSVFKTSQHALRKFKFLDGQVPHDKFLHFTRHS